MPPTFQERLDALHALKDEHFGVGKIIMGLGRSETPLHAIDVFANAYLQRSLWLTEGFCTLVETRNFLTAAPLVRLQIDNCARFHAAFLVEMPIDLLLSVMRGKPIGKHKDRDGNTMTDRYLVEKLAASVGDQRIVSVYEQACGYVHFSEKHILHTLSGDGGPEGNRWVFHLGDRDFYAQDDLYLKLMEVFEYFARLLLSSTSTWARAKMKSVESAPHLWMRAATGKALPPLPEDAAP